MIEMQGQNKKKHNKQIIAVALFIIGAGLMLYAPRFLKSDEISILMIDTILSTIGTFTALIGILLFIGSTWGTKLIGFVKKGGFEGKENNK